jgi:hypothetical protein
LEPRCGVGQWDVELRWSRVATSANERSGTPPGPCCSIGQREGWPLLGPCCGIGQREDVELRWGRVAALANEHIEASLGPCCSISQ